MHRVAILVGVMRDANCDKIINLAFARNYMMYFWIRMYLYWGNRLNQEGQRLMSHLDLLSTEPKPKEDLGSAWANWANLDPRGFCRLVLPSRFSVFALLLMGRI